MTVARRQIKKRAAKRPTPRTVTHVFTEGPYEGWEATARADFPASVLADLQSGDMDRVVRAFDRIVTDHNMPDENDEVAASMAEVDPYDGLLEMAGGLLDAMGKLPPR